MLTAVRPTFNDEVTTIQMTVLGRRTEDIDEFMEKLEATGAFEDVLPAQQDTTEEGLHRLLLESVYTGAQPEPGAAVPAGATPPTAQPPAPTPPPAKPPAPAPGRAPAAQSGRAARGGASR